MGNKDARIQQSEKRPETLLLSSIPIIFKRSEDTNNKDKDLKAKIYQMDLKTILQYIYPRFSFFNFKKKRHQ